MPSKNRRRYLASPSREDRRVWQVVTNDKERTVVNGSLTRDEAERRCLELNGETAPFDRKPVHGMAAMKNVWRRI